MQITPYGFSFGKNVCRCHISTINLKQQRTTFNYNRLFSWERGDGILNYTEGHVKNFTLPNGQDPVSFQVLDGGEYKYYVLMRCSTVQPR